MDHQTFRTCLAEHANGDDTPETFTAALQQLIDNERPTRVLRLGNRAWLTWEFTGDGTALEKRVRANSRQDNWTDPPAEGELVHEGKCLGFDTAPDADTAAAHYRDKFGWFTIKQVLDAKKPVGKWPDESHKKFDGCNVFIRTGERSRNLVDIDLDCPEARQIADVVLADCPAFGRGGNVTHRICYADAPPQTRQLKHPDLGMIVELRGGKDDKKTGSMFPPSVHPESGETLEWFGDPAKAPVLTYKEIYARVRVIAFGAYIARIWPKSENNNRSYKAMALTGALARHDGVPDAMLDDVVVAVLRAGGDDRQFRGAKSTLERIDNDEEYIGLTTLADELGQDLKELRKLLHDDSGYVKKLLAELSAKHAFVRSVEGKPRVVNVEFDRRIGYERITFSSAGEFRTAYQDWLIPIGEGDYLEVAKKWLTARDTPRFDRVTFCPGKDSPAGEFNLWRGFTVEPKPGDCSKWKQHVLESVCRYDQTAYDYLLNWMARTIQQPWKNGEVAIVIRGLKGTGKGVTISPFGQFFGDAFAHISHHSQLTGKFNAHLAGCVVLFADEAFIVRNHQHEATLKQLITERRMMIERKGIDAAPGPSCLHILMSSNNQWVVPATFDERRFLVLETDGERRATADEEWRQYYRDIFHELNNGGREALLHELLNRDISDFDVREVPVTDTLRDQQRRTAHHNNKAERAVFEMLFGGELPPEWERISLDGGREATWIPSAALADRLGLSPQAFRSALKKAGFDGQQHPEGKRPRGWLVPPLIAAREAFDPEFDWPKDLDEWFDGDEPVPF